MSFLAQLAKMTHTSKKYLSIADMFWIFLMLNRTGILAVCFFSSEFLVQVTDGHRSFFFSDARRFIKDVFFPKVALPPELQVQITAVALF